MRSQVVVLTPPLFDQDLCLLERVEGLAVQEFVAQLAVERFDVVVLSRRARFDEQGGDAPVAVAAELSGQGDDRRRERVLVCTWRGHTTLGRAVLAERFAGAALGDVQPRRSPLTGAGDRVVV